MNQIPPDAIGVLGFDPEAVLLKEPGILLDPHFLSALHAELRSELGKSDANLTLLQMGFLHGLQDAMRAVNTAFGPEPQSPAGPSLAFRLPATDATAEPGAPPRPRARGGRSARAPRAGPVAPTRPALLSARAARPPAPALPRPPATPRAPRAARGCARGATRDVGRRTA